MDKYEEALERARELHNGAASSPGRKKWIEKIFPELAESEDERIRKFIIEELSSIRSVISNTASIEYKNLTDALTWLEKQKEQKPILEVFGFKVGDAVRLKDGDGRPHIIKLFEKIEGVHGPDFYRVVFEDNTASDHIIPGNEYPNGYFTCIEKIDEQKEQKPELPKPHKGDDTNPYDMSVSEAQEYAINRGFGIPFNDGEVYVDERHITQTVGNILRWADEHPKEQKPGTTPDNPIDPFDTKLFQDGVKEGRRLEREEQKPAEWSDADELIRKSIMEYVNPAGGTKVTLNSQLEEWYNWLKSLRPRPKDCSACSKHLDGYISGRADAENQMLEQFGAVITPEHELHMKPRWKPSEEQMTVLEKAVTFFKTNWTGAKVKEQLDLESLYNDLKALINGNG